MARERISRKDFLKRAGLGLGGLGGRLLDARPQGGPSANPEPAEHPVHLHGPAALVARLPEKLPLPTFRRLLREGRGFRNYHVHQAPCGPSRVDVLHRPAHPEDRHVHEPARRVRHVARRARRAASSCPSPASRRSARCCASRATTRPTRASGTCSVMNQKVGRGQVSRLRRKRSRNTASPTTTTTASTRASRGPASATTA